MTVTSASVTSAADVKVEVQPTTASSRQATENNTLLDLNKIDEVKRRTSTRTKKQIDEQNMLIPNMKQVKGFKKIRNITDNYILGKELGSGSFGTVRLGQHRQTKVAVAIKIIKKSKLRESEVYWELMKSELKVLEEADHPNITRVFELMEDSQSFFVVMEFCSGGNLLDRVIKMRSLTEKVAVDIVDQILLALNYMHKAQMMHRDLKPENMLV